METIEGSVSHLQNTVSVSGGGNTQATTTYIVLFRLDGRAVQFRCGGPIPIADGDRIKVAGRARSTDFLAYACRDLTTDATMNSGVWGNVIMAVVLPLFGLFFCGIAWMMLGKFAVVLYLGFVVGAAFLVRQAIRVSSATKAVQR